MHIFTLEHEVFALFIFTNILLYSVRTAKYGFMLNLLIHRTLSIYKIMAKKSTLLSKHWYQTILQ